MESCGGAHHWGRQIIAMGHDRKLTPPTYVKPFVKRRKMWPIRYSGPRCART